MTSDEQPIYPLSGDPRQFPDPRHASSDGLLAWGGDLSPERLLNAYSIGIFPWFNEDDPVLWWSPDPRLVLYPEDIKVSKSFRRILRNSEYEVKFDHNFAEVITQCGHILRPGQDGTWLHDDMMEAYKELHRLGYAHSVETYVDGELTGGLYGIAMGKAFFGESMFAIGPNASKISLKALSDVLAAKSYDLIDCQVETEHLVRMGAVTVSRDRFLDELQDSVAASGDLGKWTNYQWEYKDEKQ
jgi:leucyl/phenylalanyl-tRNA--protein transferase